MHAFVHQRSASRAGSRRARSTPRGSSGEEVLPELMEPLEVDGDDLADEEECEKLVHDAGSEDASTGEAEGAVAAAVLSTKVARPQRHLGRRGSAHE